MDILSVVQNMDLSFLDAEFLVFLEAQGKFLFVIVGAEIVCK